MAAEEKQEAIARELEKETDADPERVKYLQSLNILLKQAVKDLKNDMKLD